MNEQNEKHTPGPWHIGMKPGPMIYGPQGEQVADLSARLVPDGEMVNNARLIVAAPELLDALENLTGDRFDCVEDNPDEGASCFFCGGSANRNMGKVNHESSCDWVKARAAIAKATGATNHE